MPDEPVEVTVVEVDTEPAGVMLCVWFALMLDVVPLYPWLWSALAPPDEAEIPVVAAAVLYE